MSFTLSVIAALLCSIAVSLWRIDRALRRKTEVNFGFEMTEDQQSALYHQLGHIAWEAGRNFQAGTRTDR